MMENGITLQTKTTPKDYKSLIFFNMFLKKRAMFIFLIVAAAFSLAAILGRLTGAVAMSDWYFFVCLAFWGLLVLQYLAFEFVVRRFLASDKLVINKERTVIINETGISVDEKEQSFAVYQWDAIFLAYERKQYFYLYLNTALAIVLPKRDLQQDELLLLERLIKEKLGKKYHKR